MNNRPQTPLVLQVVHSIDIICTLNACGRITLRMNTFFSYIKYKFTLQGKNYFLIPLDSMVVQYEVPVLLISLLTFFSVVELVVFPSDNVSLITKDLQSVANLPSKPLLSFLFHPFYKKISIENFKFHMIVIIQNQ